MPDDFFQSQSDGSAAKTRIVVKYFKAWSAIMKPRSERVGYFDLFAGPGCYDDGQESTPLRILRLALADQALRERLVVWLNEADPERAGKLRRAVRSLPEIERLSTQPNVTTIEAGEPLAEYLASLNKIPALLFADPWGYRGLSRALLASVLKDWGSDCIFFFNYVRFNMGLTNDAVRPHMDAFFGADVAKRLRDTVPNMAPWEREAKILECAAEAVKAAGARYTLPFRFVRQGGKGTSHFLVFASKNFLGYEIMKQIMATESSNAEQGVASFQYSPADRRFPMLFELARPMDDLGPALLAAFAGRTLTTLEIYKEHSVGRPYLKKHYKMALAQMEREGAVTAQPAAAARPKGTFADSVRVSFPAGGGR
jgi:three-Cys-motif partner protein